MCVIAFVDDDDNRPTREQARAMWERNDHGGGVAWREGAKIRWRKGIKTSEEMEDYILTLPVPFVAHFRIASVGAKCDELTHPFPVERSVRLDLGGSTKAVMFHNGTWGEWKKILFASAIGSGIRIPNGPWSDSRALAWITALVGTQGLEMLGEKVIYLPATGEPEMFGAGWSLVDGFYVSNLYWQSAVSTIYKNRPGVNGNVLSPVGGWCGYPSGQKRDDWEDTLPPKQINPPLQGTGAASAVVPFFERPLSYFEQLQTQGSLSKQGLKKIRKAWRSPEGIRRRELAIRIATANQMRLPSRPS